MRWSEMKSEAKDQEGDYTKRMQPNGWCGQNGQGAEKLESQPNCNLPETGLVEPAQETAARGIRP
jgi:hypothetical protein